MAIYLSVEKFDFVGRYLNKIKNNSKKYHKIAGELPQPNFVTSSGVRMVQCVQHNIGVLPRSIALHTLFKLYCHLKIIGV